MDTNYLETNVSQPVKMTNIETHQTEDVMLALTIVRNVIMDNIVKFVKKVIH